MIVRKLVILLVCSLFAICTFAQGIRGHISNPQDEAIAFATVYVPQISKGTVSNPDGTYELKLPQGQHEIIIKYLGYKTQTFDLPIGPDFQELNVVLVPQNYQIPEIKVLASGEDPAYYVMRHAIAMAPYYQNQVSKYSCKVYLKGSGVFEKIPFLFEKQLKKGGLKEDEPFAMETVSKISFELPDKLNQQVLAMRSSGKDNNTSPMGMITNSLYDADKYGVVSPVGKNALKTYRFALAGVFEDQGRIVNKIMVTPKINSNDVFSGFIYIVDGFWNIHSADLHVHLPMTDVQARQVYSEVNHNTWMPVSLNFDIDFSGLGFRMKYNYVASVSDYLTTLNPLLDHSFLDRVNQQSLPEKAIGEEKVNSGGVRKSGENYRQIDSLLAKKNLDNREARKLNRLIDRETRRNAPPEPLEIQSAIDFSQKQVINDSAYWAALRPIPLTEAEKISFAGKDSLLRLSASPEFQDSVRDSKRKFKIKHLIFGKTYDYSADSVKNTSQFSIPGFINPSTLSFNSVDGLRLDLPFKYLHSDSSGRMTRITPQIAYAFARKKVDASLTFQQRLNGLANSWFSVSGGSTTSDFNRSTPLNSLTNDFYTLWFEKNYQRFYQRDFLQLMYRHDLINGLTMNILFDYSNNYRLENHSNYSFVDYEERTIQPNIPLNQTLNSDQLGNHQSLVGRIEFEYTPRNRYRIKNNVKEYAGSKFPTYSLIYRAGISNILGSDTRYDLVKAGIRQRIDFGIGDQVSYQVSTGKFLNSKKIFFEDFQHFNTQPTGFMFASYESSYRLLPFYQYSTTKSFVDVHANWQSRRLVLKQLPLLRNSALLSEKVFFNMLSTPELKNYAEAGYGINNLFLLLNAEVVLGFENGSYSSAGIRVSINLR